MASNTDWRLHKASLGRPEATRFGDSEGGDDKLLPSFSEDTSSEPQNPDDCRDSLFNPPRDGALQVQQVLRRAADSGPVWMEWKLRAPAGNGSLGAIWKPRSDPGRNPTYFILKEVPRTGIFPDPIGIERMNLQIQTSSSVKFSRAFVSATFFIQTIKIQNSFFKYFS